MRSVPVLAAVALGAAAVISGCGRQHTGTPAGPPQAGAPSPLPAGASSPPPNSGSQSGTVKCGAIPGFRVSVRVS